MKTRSALFYALSFLFFFQLLIDFVGGIYAFGLLGTSIPPELAAVILLFSPILLLFFRRPGRRLLAILLLIILLARVIEPALDTRWRMLVSGAGVAACFAHLRTVVLVKSPDLTTLTVFEFETVFYPPENYTWQKNKNGNLEAIEKHTGAHRFTWQPHGSRFTIIEPVPQNCLLVTLKSPPRLDKDEVLAALHYDDSWVTVTHRK